LAPAGQETSDIVDVTRPAGPLAGKTVAIVHAAWHSCGSYQVNVCQLRAYKALGARVISIAMMDTPAPRPPGGGRWRGYIAATQDLPADARYYSSAPITHLWTPSLLRDGWWRLIHGDQATWLIEIAKRIPVPAGFENESIDLIHANHYFTLPFVERLTSRRAAPVILETQDIQARQYVLRNQGGLFLRPQAGYDDMLAVELDWMRRADLCVHLNDEECTAFEALLPSSRHALVYPAVPSVEIGAGGGEIVIVASDNYANYMSMRWFLTQVRPLAMDIPVSIYGNIDQGVRARDKALFSDHRALFRGRVENIGNVYANAACVLLPTTHGHGLSIKAVEAFSSGAPLIATRAAFRGMKLDLAQLANVTIADDAEIFAAAMRKAYESGAGARSNSSRAQSDTRRLYEREFSMDAYVRALKDVALPLVSR
jgi:polysaccharide biosynthesis protein PslH